MKVKALILFLALAAMLPLTAQAQINYAVSDTNTAYVAYSPNAFGNIVISNRFEGYPVTSIGEEAFEDCGNLKSVVIPNSVTSIGDDAFYDCIGLTSVTIPNSVTNIAWQPFFGCSALTNIVIGNGITSIGRAEFYNCYSLANITIGTNVTNIGAGAFVACTNLTSIIIPNSVTNIDGGAFEDCFSLTNVTFLGNSVTLGSYVFSGDNHVTIYYYYGTSGWSGFYYGFRTAMLGVVPFTYFTNSETIIITSYTGTNDAVTIGPVINGFPVTDIDFNDFTVPQEYTNLTSITIPASVTGIGSDAFYGCINLTNVTFLGNAPNLGQDVFNGDLATVYYYYGASGWGTNYGGLPVVELDVPFTYTTNNDVITITGYIGTDRTVTIGAPINDHPVTSVGEGAFIGSALTSITITANITNIDDEAFQNCAALTDITFLGNAPVLGGANVFANDSATIYFYYGTCGWGAIWGGTAYGGLPTEVLDAPLAYTLNNSAVTITSYNGSGGAVIIPDAIDGYFVTSIGEDAFKYNDSLTSIVLPNHVTYIGSAAFQLCASLTSVAIPSSVTYIGDIAFNLCNQLTNILVDAANPTYSSTNGVLFDKAQTTLIQFPGGLGGNYTIPNSVTNLGDFAFANCTSLTSVTIPDSVANIDSISFYICTSLTNITFLGNAPTLVVDNFTVWGVPTNATVYYYYGTSGWDTTYGGLSTIELAWTPQIVGGASVQSNNFGFTIIGTNGMPFVVEASTNLVDWQPVWTNILFSVTNLDGYVTFTDSQWTNYPARFYRAR